MDMAVYSSSLNILLCYNSTFGGFIINAFLITKVLLFLPLSIAVLYLAHQGWMQQRSFATTSHCDIFPYHSVVIELIYGLGTVFYFCGSYSNVRQLIQVGYCLCSVMYPGETLFHILTCVESYVAVVHPIVYLGLRQSQGVKIRNISIGSVWLLCFGCTGVTALYFPQTPNALYLSLLVLSLLVVSYCSLSVLCALIHPGPGEKGKDRERFNQAKQRAFYTIRAITAVLWLYFIGFIVCLALISSHVLSFNCGCVVLLFANVISVPSSLTLPLLFLQREGTLVCF